MTIYGQFAVAADTLQHRNGERGPRGNHWGAALEPTEQRHDNHSSLLAIDDAVC